MNIFQRPTLIQEFNRPLTFNRPLPGARVSDGVGGFKSDNQVIAESGSKSDNQLIAENYYKKLYKIPTLAEIKKRGG